jgi:hypothetical protein
MENDEVEVEFAVLDSIGDTLLQDKQILAISPDKGMRKHGVTIVTRMAANSELELPAELPISEVSKVSLISATVVPNADDRHGGNREGGQSGGPLGNIRQIMDGSSRWKEVKIDPLQYAVG